MVSDLISSIYNDSILWQMSRAERHSFISVLDHLTEDSRDKIAAVEIGTYTGGTLQHLVNYFDKVVSVDIGRSYLHPSLMKRPNVDYITGDSTKVDIPKIIAKTREEFDIKFFLIDANHEYEYVKADLNNVLTYIPKSETIILLHDSWYPPSRQAIIDSNLKASPYVHFVDTDFCTGELIKDEIYGGLCLVRMLPEVRQGDLEVRQSQDYFFRRLRENSK